jgi:hypothetical protein
MITYIDGLVWGLRHWENVCYGEEEEVCRSPTDTLREPRLHCKCEAALWLRLSNTGEWHELAQPNTFAARANVNL